MRLIKDVFDNYIATHNLNGGVAKNINSSSQIALKVGIPSFFESIVRSSHLPIDRYKFQGSYGNTGMTHTPWVATFDTRITSSAQNGFDIVLLFAKDMQSCVLSLNQGYKAFTEEFKKHSLALKKIKETAEKARAYLQPIAGATYGPIDLKAETANSKGYELGAIASFIYPASSLPSEEHFAADYKKLLNAYEELFNLAGPNLMSLQALTDSEFQKELEEVLVTEEQNNQDEIIGPEERPSPLPSVVGVKYKRDIKKSKKALKNSNFRCEYSISHESFVSGVTGKMYVEAHHLIPMSEQAKYENSLDVVANIVALCPNCHRLIHHGIYEEKAKLVESVFSLRQSAILKKGIQISISDLLKIYKGTVEETD